MTDRKLKIIAVLWLALLLVAWALLSGCGGSGGNQAAAPPPWSRPAMPSDFEFAFKLAHEARIDGEGKNWNCSHYAARYHDILQREGFPNRTMHVVLGLNSASSHTFNEVWLNSQGRWIVFDATFSTYYTVRGVPADTMQIHDALAAGLRTDLAPVHFLQGDTRFEDLSEDAFLIFRTPIYVWNNQQDGGAICLVTPYSRCWENIHNAKYAECDRSFFNAYLMRSPYTMKFNRFAPDKVQGCESEYREF